MKINPLTFLRINPHIFRAYDIRGLYPLELNEESAYLIGRAFAEFLKKEKPKIIIGRDNRLSSPSLFRAVTKGVLDQGGKVVDIGLATSPMFYWAVARYGFDGGIQVSASHNPPEFNGFKLVGKAAFPISQASGLKKIKNLTEKLANQNLIKPTQRGKITKKKVLADYIKFNLKDFDIQKIRHLKIVVDTANAVPGISIPYLKKALPVKIYHLFSKLDGRFPNHAPNPLIERNLTALKKEISRKKADLGVAFDGDGDRIVFLDEKGEALPGDLITALLAKNILKNCPGAKVLYDIRSSNIVKETIKKEGGRPLVYRIGHSFIKEKMKKENVLFGGEFSGHFYHKGHYFTEAPIFVLLKILGILSKERKFLSEIVRPLKKYYHSGEINFKVQNKKSKIKQLKKHYWQGRPLTIDGLRVDFSDWWFLVRPSNTEPVLRLVVEAKTKKLMEQKKKELSKFISK